MLKFKADLRTLFFMSVAAALLVYQWTLPTLNPLLILASCFMAISITSIAHNHNHLGMWESPLLNRFTDYALTLLYGYPTFAWIPTHNTNHHVHNNNDQDYTATFKVGLGNNLLTLIYYPAYSGRVQQRAVFNFMKSLWKKDRQTFIHNMFQVLFLVALYVVAFTLSWKKALLLIFLPHQIGLNTVLVFNYIQHVHVATGTKYNHSRNFVGSVMNGFLFNNGYHTVHHIHPRKHWSLAREAHAQIADEIDPSLSENNFAWFMFRTYILSMFMTRYRTVQMPKVTTAKESVMPSAPMLDRVSVSL